MDLERKLQILADCDFSVWRKWRRAGDAHNPPSSIYGFGNALAELFTSILNIVDSRRKEEAVEIIYKGYGNLMIDYSRIPFEEMDPEDEDFKFLFEYKAMLEELGKKLAVFIDKCHATKFKCSRDWPEFEDLILLRNKMKEKDYGSEVLDKYRIEFSEPPLNSAGLEN